MAKFFLLLPYAEQFLGVAVTVRGDHVLIAKRRILFLPEIEFGRMSKADVGFLCYQSEEDIVETQKLSEETSVIQI